MWATESVSTRRSAEGPDTCTETFQEPRYSPGRLSENVSGEVPCTFELFAGSCKLSKCLKAHGFSAVGVDHKKCKNRVGPCIVMDLSHESSARFIEKKVDEGIVYFIPMAPPCGTASRARDKPIPRWLRQQGVPSPPPLRSAEYPSGLPGLKGTDLTRVELANACYATAARIFKYGHSRGVIVFIENPTNSYMWMVPCIAALFNLSGVYFTTFQVCMHGGERDKKTSLLHNCKQLQQLGVMCDRQHAHKGWSVSKSLSGKWQYDTASEAEYPLLLCQRIAAIISQLAHAQNLPIHLEARSTPLAQQASTAWRVAAGRQPRGRRAQAMLPEDGQVVEVEVKGARDCHKVANWSGRSKTDTFVAGRVFPAGTRILHRFPSNEGEDHGDEHDGGAMKVVFGIPMTPEEAVRRAHLLQHPFDTTFQTPDHVLDSMFQVLTKGSQEVHDERVRRLKWMKAKVAELEGQEHELHAGMETKVAEVMAPKKLLLFAELIKMVGYADSHLIEDMCRGMQITGEGRVTGCFAQECKPPVLDREDLWRGSKSAQREVEAKIPRHMAGRRVEVAGEEVEVAQEVWAATMKEVEKGWLAGPLSASQVSEAVGPLWTPSRRFGIVQGAKVRNIDDLSEFAVNQSYGPGEKLDLGGVDEVVSLAASWMRAFGKQGDEVQVRLSSGLVLEGRKCEEFRGVGLHLSGRCLDLKSAYKQLALSPADRSCAVIAVLDPEVNRVKYFVSYVLPFGATGSVMAFNRAARALREVLQRFLFLPVVNYFDDFPHVDLERMVVRSQVVMEEAFRVLGWGIAEEAKKRTPPARRLVVLGVVIDLNQSQDGVVVVRNKDERVDELEATITEVESLGVFPPATAAKVYGRLNFAEAQCSGRWLAPLLGPVKQRALMARTVRGVTREIREALQTSAELLRQAPPRRLEAVNGEEPCLVFTDGAYEDGVATCGAVLISPRLERAIAFGFKIQDEIVADWHGYGHEHVIAQAEMLPIVIVKCQFAPLLKGARVLYFIDNEGVKEALVAGVTKSAHASRGHGERC